MMAEFGQNQRASEAESDSTDAFLQDGAITSTILYLNNPGAYLLKGWKWTATDPQINLILKNDAVLASKGLGADATRNAIAAAADTWDNAVAKNLFADGNALVTLDPGANVDAQDNRNVHAWASISGGLAYTRTYSSLRCGRRVRCGLQQQCLIGPRTASINMMCRRWLFTSWGTPLGLGIFMGRRNLHGDTDEMMHYYAGPRRSLGPGDRTGVQALYGPSGPLYCMSAPYTAI